jgi:hypothetical protein
MARNWGETFGSWTGAEGTVEEDKAQRTLQRVRDALQAATSLASEDVVIYPKGSYPNRTNVVRDSDIDVAVELTSLRQHEFTHDASDLGLSDVGLTRYTGSFDVTKFKDYVEEALRAQFSAARVTRGNKAIRIEATNTTLPVDVVPCQTLVIHTSATHSHIGIEIRPDRGARIINYPRQHLEQGLMKNDGTSKRYKRTVRILKRLENEMVSKHIISVVPSFLIESLVWNVRRETFMTPSTWDEVVRSVIVDSHRMTVDDDAASDLVEANAIKYLFHVSQPWTRKQANDFLHAAWSYVGFN